MSNFNEWLAQTKPAEPTSYLHITQTTRTVANQTVTLDISFPGVAGRHYTVEGSTDLNAWSPIVGPFLGTTGPNPVTVSFSNLIPPNYFLRVRVGP